MLPHRDGETAALASALQACAMGLRNLRAGQLDETAARWLVQLRELMGVPDEAKPVATERAAWLPRAAQMDVDQRADVSRLVDELAHWFDRHQQ